MNNFTFSSGSRLEITKLDVNNYEKLEKTFQIVYLLGQNGC